MKWELVGQSKLSVVEPSLYFARGNKLVDFSLPPGLEISDKGKGMSGSQHRDIALPRTPGERHALTDTIMDIRNEVNPLYTPELGNR